MTVSGEQQAVSSKRDKPIIRNSVVCLLITVLLLAGSVAEAQKPKAPRVGFLGSATPAAVAERIEAFRQGLRELGYVEGKDVVVEYRYAEGKRDRLSELAAELVRLKMDVIVAQNNTVARAASRATKTTPIVMADGADPVASGLVASLARPGGNVTGLTNVQSDLGVKRLELLKEVVPNLTRVAVLPSPSARGVVLKELKEAARSLKIETHILEVRVADDLETAFKGAANARVGALTMTPDPAGLFMANQKQILELVTKNKLPAIYHISRWVDAGGLMSYSADQLESYRRTAVYVDKILKGAKPAELPVEQPTKFEFALNLKAANQIGLTVPPNVLARADKVIR
jgi:putative tryptophan/tyrosine transport system substrate-binding protein